MLRAWRISLQGRARWLGKAQRLGSRGRRFGRSGVGVRGVGEAVGKPAVTALALINQLQSPWRGSPALVCALLTQASKTFVS